MPCSYNYAYVPHTGGTVERHEMHTTCEISDPGCLAATGTSAEITRNPQAQGNGVTVYEIKVPAVNFGGLRQGSRLGVGVCVNDGDAGALGEDIGESGQKGWSGWGPYTLVHGRTIFAVHLSFICLFASVVALGQHGAQKQYNTRTHHTIRLFIEQVAPCACRQECCPGWFGDPGAGSAAPAASSKSGSGLHAACGPGCSGGAEAVRKPGVPNDTELRNNRRVPLGHKPVPGVPGHLWRSGIDGAH